MRIQSGVKVLALLFAVSVGSFAAAQAIHGHEEHPSEALHAKASASLPTYEPVPKLSGHIRSVGADTMENLTKAWIVEFQKIYPGVQFDVEAKASATAAPALTNGPADIGPVPPQEFPQPEAPLHAHF